MIHNGVMIKPVRIPEMERFRAPGLSPWEPPERIGYILGDESSPHVTKEVSEERHARILQCLIRVPSGVIDFYNIAAAFTPSSSSRADLETHRQKKRILLPKCLKPHSQQNIQGHEQHQFGCSSVFGERVYCQCSMLWTLPSLDPKQLINMGQNRNEAMSWARIYRNRITLITSWFIHSYAYTHAYIYIHTYNCKIYIIYIYVYIICILYIWVHSCQLVSPQTLTKGRQIFSLSLSARGFDSSKSDTWIMVPNPTITLLIGINIYIYIYLHNISIISP